MKGRWTARRERIRPLNAKGALPIMVRHAAQRTRHERLKNKERKILTTYCSLLACEIVARCWRKEGRVERRKRGCGLLRVEQLLHNNDYRKVSTST